MLDCSSSLSSLSCDCWKTSKKIIKKQKTKQTNKKDYFSILGHTSELRQKAYERRKSSGTCREETQAAISKR